MALVWQLGEIGPLAQVSLAGGFLLEAEAPYGELVSTKSAAWESKPVNGIAFHSNIENLRHKGYVPRRERGRRVGIWNLVWSRGISMQ